jgi:hypothetical protein
MKSQSNFFAKKTEETAERVNHHDTSIVEVVCEKDKRVSGDKLSRYHPALSDDKTRKSILDQVIKNLVKGVKETMSQIHNERDTEGVCQSGEKREFAY